VPGSSVQAGRENAHHDVVLPDGGLVDLIDPEDVLGRGAVLVLDDRRHRRPVR
jgi:hypothetical protein